MRRREPLFLNLTLLITFTAVFVSFILELTIPAVFTFALVLTALRVAGFHQAFEVSFIIGVPFFVFGLFGVLLNRHGSDLLNQYIDLAILCYLPACYLLICLFSYFRLNTLAEVMTSMTSGMYPRYSISRTFFYPTLHIFDRHDREVRIREQMRVILPRRGEKSALDTSVFPIDANFFVPTRVPFDFWLTKEALPELERRNFQDAEALQSSPQHEELLRQFIRSQAAQKLLAQCLKNETHSSIRLIPDSQTMELGKGYSLAKKQPGVFLERRDSSLHYLDTEIESFITLVQDLLALKGILERPQSPYGSGLR